MEALLVLLGLVYLVSPIALAVLWFRERRARLGADEQQARSLRELERRLARLERPGVAGSAPREPPRATEPSSSPLPSTGPSAAAREAFAPPPPASAEEAIPTVVVPPSSPVPAASAVPPASPRVEPPLPTVPYTAPQAAPPAVPPRAPAPPPPPAAPRSFDWESLVGVRLFSWMAGVTLLVAAVAFLRYSMEHGWLGPSIRTAIGLALGVGLLVVCESRAAQRYRPTALALTAAGIATLFSTLYAAHALWRLLPALPTFALMALVTAVAVLLSIRRDSVFIALLGLVGGFATPMLLSTGEDRPIGLFSYLAMLDVGLAWVAYRKRWPLLSSLSLGFTAVYQLGWVARFLEPEKLPIGAAIFLAFPIVAFGGLALGRRGASLGDQERQFRLTAALAAVPPVLFAFHVASAGAYGEQWPLLFGFVFLVAAGLAVVAAWQGPEWLHLLGGAGVLASFGGFVARSFVPEAWPGLLAFIALFVALYLGAPVLLARREQDFTLHGRLGAFAAPLLLFVFPALAATQAAAGPALFFVPLLLLAAACAAFAVRRGEGPIHFVAAAAAVAGEALWSGFHLTPERLLPALLAYGAFGLFFLGVPLLAERLGRPLRPAGSGAFLLLASLALLFFLAAGPLAQAAIWGIAALALFLEAGLLFEGARGRNPLLVLAGLVLGFAVLVVWWVTAMAAALLLPALFAVGALALLALGGSLVAARRREQEAPGEAKRLGHGALVGLAGHAFLLLVVSDPALAAPPWPWLAVLFLLDLAFLVASLVRREGTLLAGAAVGSTLVLARFAGRFEEYGPALAAAAVAVAALGLAGALLAPRRGTEPRAFLPGGAVALFGAQGVLLLAAQRGGLELPLLLAAHLALLLGLLLLAWRTGAHWIPLAAALSTFVSTGWARFPEPPDDGRRLALATPLYLVQLAHPLLLGARARRERLPFAAAIAASAAFFLIARDAILGLGGEAGIGLLPVAQAALLVPHLVLLLRMEPPAERDRGRLALMAAAILAFVTVAIPLQLERQWITIGWALQGAALAWLYRRLAHKGLLGWSAALFAVVFIRLALNPSVFDYQPKSETPILNWYLYTYLVTAAACYAGAVLLARTEDRLLPGIGWLPRASRILPALGTILLFLLVNIEIADFFTEGSRIAFRFSAGLAQDLTYTIAWAIFAILVLAAGVILRAKVARFAAIALLFVTVIKGFLHDLSKLDGLYRVASFVGLAMSLALVAIVLQRFVLRSTDGDHSRPENA